MSRINLGGGKSISIRDYAVGLAHTGTAAGALRYAQGKDDGQKKARKPRETDGFGIDNVGGSR